jgi:hypothetical protein
VTIPVPALDKYTHLGEMGYNQRTLQERLDKFYQDLTALNTIGEILVRSLDQTMAREVLGITGGGVATVTVPAGINASGTADGTTALFGDATWQFVPKTKADIGLSNVDNTSDATKPVSAPQAAALLPKNDLNATGTSTFQNLTVTGSVDFVDGSIPQADIQGLVTDLNNRIAVIASTADVTVSIMYQFKTSNPNAVRPPIPTAAMGVWDLPGSVPPVNALPQDKWLR